MDANIVRLFAVMIAVMVPVAIGGAVYALITSFGRRAGTRTGPPDSQALQQVLDRLDELERREARIQDLEERLDFIERVLPPLRDARPLLEMPRAPKERTPA